jgi:hypothetical protein
LGTDFYRDLVAGTGPFELLRKQFPEPGRDLPGMLGLFDIEAGDGPQDEILRMHLTMVLALWADYIGVEALEADPHAWFPATQREREEYKCAQQEEVVVISHVESWI